MKPDAFICLMLISVFLFRITFIFKRIMLQAEIEIEEDEENIAVKVPKKKVPKVAEDTKSKKEHVNVVFIGHVG